MPGKEDYYRFEGVKGQVLYIDVDAQDIDQVQFDPTYIDSVVTLFKAGSGEDSGRADRPEQQPHAVLHGRQPALHDHPRRTGRTASAWPTA